MKTPLIFLGQPTYGPVSPQAAAAFWRAGTNDEKFQVAHAGLGRSLLANGFNSLWCCALNQRKMGITHFAMLHADVAPVGDWLETLLDELTATGADVLSVVVPIKNSDGLTSTAIAHESDTFDFERRLTMTEVFQLPETFRAADLGYSDRALLVNTGCWICDFTKPWVEDVWFEINDRIRRDAHGVFHCDVEPEDWNFSRQLHAKGLDVRATRKVELQHIGQTEYPNSRPWGTLKHDRTAKGKPLPGKLQLA